MIQIDVSIFHRSILTVILKPSRMCSFSLPSETMKETPLLLLAQSSLRPTVYSLQKTTQLQTISHLALHQLNIGI